MSFSERVRRVISGEQKPKAPRPSQEEWLCTLAANVLAGIKNDKGEPVFFEGNVLQDCPKEVLQQLGAVVLEGGVRVEIAEVCDGINAVGGAENPRIRVTPRGVERPLYRNIISGVGYPDEEPLARSFTLLDNPVNGQIFRPTDSLLDGVLKADSLRGIGSGIGPLH